MEERYQKYLENAFPYFDMAFSIIRFFAYSFKKDISR